MKKKRVIRIYNAGPFPVEIGRDFYLKKATLVKGWWDEKWIRDDNGKLKCFKRRCDASRWAGKHYPGWERQHWFTI